MAPIMNLSAFVNLPECYRILKVEPGASWPVVKRSYRSLALRCHPDHHPGDPGAEEEFKNLVRAFETLLQYYESKQLLGGDSAPEERAGIKAGFSFFRFDRNPSTSEDPGPFDSDTEARRGSADSPGGWKFWSDKAWRTLKKLERKWLMLDVEMPVTLDPAVADTGGGIKIRRGFEAFEVRIPPQVLNGSLIRVPGKGDSGILHRKRGDLWIRIQIRQAKSANQPAEEYFYQVTLKQKEIRQRTVFTLNTPQGPLPYSLPKTTRDGQVFVLYGAKNPISGRRFRHVVTINLV